LSAVPAKTWALLRPYARKRLPVLLLVLALGAVSGAAQSIVLPLFVPLWRVLFPDQALPLAEGNRVERLFAPLERWARESELFGDPRLAMLSALCALALAMGLVGALAQWGFTWFSRRATYQVLVDLRVDVARHLMGLSMRYHGGRRLGDLLSRVSSDVTALTETINVGMKGLVQEPLQALWLVGVAFFLAPQATLGVVLVLPLALWPVARLTRRVRKGSKKSLSSLGDSVQSLSQMFQGVRTVKAFGGEEREIERYRTLNRTYLASAMRMVRAIALTHAWTVFYSIAGVVALVFVIGWLRIRGQLFSDGVTMIAFLGAIGQLSRYVKDITKSWTKVEESVGAAARIQELLDEAPDVVESPEPRRIARIERELRFEQVTFRYPGGEAPAIRELSLAIRPGETLALVGPSGAGKSTLVDLLARFIDPSEGRILVDGVDLRGLALRDWNALYAMVGQVPFLFHSSIGENIAYGRPDASQDEIEAAARAAHIHDFVARLPQGYATNVADMGSRLSGGQRQRITIARALLKGAPLLLLDEATSALDSESEAEVQRALDELMRERTVVVVAHRLATIQRADRIAVLEHGRLVELGRHDELIARGGVYARLWALQKLETPAGAV
jgi:ABC-type multidrug transport system fused ATPase/permease subunit